MKGWDGETKPRSVLEGRSQLGGLFDPFFTLAFRVGVFFILFSVCFCSFVLLLTG